MKLLFVPANEKANRLIIIFLGWGFPAESFRSLHKPGYDILLVGRYDEKELDLSEFTSYDEYVVIGWSFGVRMATTFLSSTNLQNITLRLAVNGTVHHIDDRRGIPEAIFNGTLRTLSPQSLQKFRLRSAGNKYTFQKFFPDEPTSEIFESLRSELELFGKIPRDLAPNEQSELWDKAIIGERDRIFPADNQREAWKDIDVFIEPEMDHLPDFQQILNSYILDKSKVTTKFQGAGTTYPEHAAVQRRVATRLLEIANCLHHLNRIKILELGYGDGMLTEMLLDVSQHSTLDAYDIKYDKGVVDRLEAMSKSNHNITRFHTADVETQASLGKEYDLIISSSMLQWLNSPAQLLRKCKESLIENKGGMIAFSFYGPGTLREISDLTGNGLKYPSLTSLTRFAKNIGLEIQTAQEETVTLTFPTPADALRHLKLTGVNALPQATPTATVRRLMAEWPRNASHEATLTFECKYLIATLR